MASSPGAGKIPEFTPAEVKNWLDKQSAGVGDLTEVLIIVFAVLGLVIFLIGLAQYMRESRESASGGGSGVGRHGAWMMVVGGALGAIDLIYIFLVAIVRPAGM